MHAKRLAFVVGSLLAARSFGQAPPHSIPTGTDSVLHASPGELFNGWRLSPAGRHVGVNAMPMKMALSPDGRTLAAVCAGRWDGLALVDVKSEQTRQWLPLPRAFNGVAFSPDGHRIYVTGGNSDALHVFDFDGGRATEGKAIRLAGGTMGGADEDPDAKAAPPKRKEPSDQHGSMADHDRPAEHFQTGLAVDPKSGRLYVCDEGADAVLVVDPVAGKVIANWPTRAHPYTCAIGAGGAYLYVSNWGDRSVSAIDMRTGKQAARIGVGLRPNEMAVGPDGRLFVCCAGDNTVHVIQTAAPKDNDKDAATDEKAPPPELALEILSTSLYPSSPEGSTPDGVAVSPDGKSLFVANADNNDVMVADLADPKVSRVVGFVPVGWYPTAVASDGNHLFVANGKGLSAADQPGVPAKRPDPGKVGGITYNNGLGVLSGSVSIIDPPTPEQLAGFTAQVRADSPYTPATLRRSAQPNDSCIPSKVGGDCPITHVLYVIKENRTYDQVYGDMADASGKHIGNGDPGLAMFGERVTPNQHALARQYVLMDDLYCNSEVSVDGHAWCDLAIANDYNQRNWITSYTKHGHLPGNADTEATLAGSLWDACKRAGISFKCYGEGAADVPTANRGTWAGKRDPDKVKGWIADLHAAEQPNNDLPQFMIMSLGENHTKGTRVGEHTPIACVASNDLAVGQIVEAASHSKYWPTMAIFIIEDDSQNGPDHVDAHRTGGLVVSPYVRRGLVDSTHYTQMSMVRTMELILGLPPLTQYDAAGVPMFSAFASHPDTTPFTAIGPRVDLAAKNKPGDAGAAASAKMDFDDYDDAPEDPLNRILWASVMGPDVPYPTPIHRALFDR
jgi:YVTN family beta-propeller protein